jgi:hypothetical protein
MVSYLLVPTLYDEKGIFGYFVKDTKTNHLTNILLVEIVMLLIDSNTYNFANG